MWAASSGGFNFGPEAVAEALGGGGAGLEPFSLFEDLFVVRCTWGGGSAGFAVGCGNLGAVEIVQELMG